MTQNAKEGEKLGGPNNPGTVLDLNEKCTAIFPPLFDGFRISIHRGLTSHFKVHHLIYLSSITPGNYRFGAAYVGDKIIGNHRGVPVLLGDVDSRANLNASFYHLFGSRFKVRFDAQMENRSFSTSQLAMHYFGNSFTASAVFANSDILSKSGCFLVQYLQNVTSSLAIGAELAVLSNLDNLKTSDLSKENVETQLAIVGKYTTPHTIWCTVVSKNNFLLSCYKQASEQIEFGVELNSNFRSNESVGTIAYKVRLPSRGIIFRAMVDSNTNVGSLFEKRVCGTPWAFSVSANLNYATSNFRLGLGITVE